MTFDSLKYERDKFDRRAKTLYPEEKNWIVQRVLRDYPALSDYKINQEHEEKLLNKVNILIYDFEKNKPSDIRAYVEKELKKSEYDKRLKDLSNRITSGLLGDNKKCDKLSYEINQLLDEAEKEFPGFRKGRALQISEIFQRIMAYRTKGAIGHQGEIREIRKEQTKP